MPDALPKPEDARLTSVVGQDPRAVGAANDAADVAQQALEAGDPTAQALPAQQPAAVLPEPDLSGDPRAPKAQYADEDEELLFGPTTRPNVPVNRGVTRRGAPEPAKLRQFLPEILEAASQPDAPPELISFLRLLQYEMGE